MKKIALCACSGMNPRGQVARVSAYDYAQEDVDCDICCIVATAGGKQKYIDLAKTHKIIAINGCKQNCTSKILEQIDVKVDKLLIVTKVLEKENLTPECTVRMNDNDEKCVERLKKEIFKVKDRIIFESIEIF